MKLLKFTAVFVTLFIFVSGIMGMSYYVGYQTAKAKYIPQIDSLWESYETAVNNFRQAETDADYWEWQAGRYKLGAEGWLTAYVQETEALQAEISTLKEQVNSKPKEVIKEIPQSLKNFETTAELKRWLDNTPILMPGWANADCDDFALMLIEEATQDGYYLYFFPDLYHKHFKVCAIAGNNVYLIEPQTHEMELYMKVD